MVSGRLLKMRGPAMVNDLSPMQSTYALRGTSVIPGCQSTLG